MNHLISFFTTYLFSNISLFFTNLIIPSCMWYSGQRKNKILKKPISQRMPWNQFHSAAKSQNSTQIRKIACGIVEYF